MSRNKQPLTAATANPNAASAAVAVFKRNEAQQASNLSAAAAAAALRARPITPTNVAEVQTKRTVRRSASVASTRTNPDTRGRPNLRRSGSSSSMTERTFRSPSPHRPDSRNSGRRQSQSIEDLPPVPALPKNVATTVGTAGAGAPQKSAHRRTQSMGVERVPSQKLGTDDAPSWFGPAKVGDLSSVRRTDPAMASPPSSPPQIAMHQEDRPESRASSINFSYPARVRVGSPPVSPADTRSTTDFPAQDSQSAVQPQRSRGSLLLEAGTPSSTRPRASSASAADKTLVYDPNSRRMIRRSDLLAVEHAIIAASQQPTRSKKKKHPPKAGTHLAQGTVGRTKSNVPTSDQTGNTGTTRTAPRVQVPAPVQQSPAVHDSRQETEERSPSRSAVTSPATEPQSTEQPQEEDSEVEEEVITDHHHPTTSTAMVVTKDGRPMVRRLPSIVREEPELEESESDETNTSRVSSALDSVPSRQKIVSHTRSQSEQQPIQSSSQASLLPIRAASVSQKKNQPHRTSSISPARQAHFGPVQDTLTVRHSPPPRSVSPRKSALKQTSPVRGPSPSDLSSEASWSTDRPVKRKKSVRVSFDDETQPAVAEPAPKERSISPPLASPTGIRRWANADLSATLDDEEVMKPRPALPSFGSVRNVRKPQLQEAKEDERPLRPIGDVAYSTPYNTPLPLSPMAESFAQSSDYAIGGVLQREREERVRSPANISRFREPLPPVVTSVEGSGYASDSDGSTSLASEMTGSLYEYPSFMDPPQQPRRNSLSSPQVSPVKTAFQNGNTHAIDSRFAQEEARRRNSAPNIPIISLTQPTPPVGQNETPRFSVEVPGGFPEDSDTSKSSATGVEQVTGQQTTGTQSQPTSESESDDSSVYADAHEDLSEAEGEGFQSLNAVLDFPGANSSRQHEITDTPSPPDPPRSLVPALSTATTAIGSHCGELPQEDDWERAKAYWRSLTAERRAQLEREAKEDAGIEGDREEMSAPVEKPRRKKSVERRNSERQALAVQMARQMMLEQQQQQQQQQAPPQEEQPRKKKTKGRAKETATPAPAPARVIPERTYQIKPGSKWEESEVSIAPVASTMMMRTTMRSAPPQPKAAPVNDGPRLRKSLRSEPPVDRRASYPDPAPVPSTPQPTKRERRAASEANIPRASTIRLASTHQSHVKRRGSTSSESSFKRARASSAGNGLSAGGFPKSLRPNSPAAGSVDSRGSGSKLLTSLRAMTPTNSNSRFDTPPSSRGTVGSGMGMGMRTTLRDSAASNGGRRSSGGMKMPTLGKKGGASEKKRTSTGSKFSSRFGDSSDEEDARISSRFRSRFDESSDEDEVVPPVPVVPSGLRGSASAPVAAAGRSMALGSMRDRQVSIAEEEEGGYDYRSGAVNGNGNARGSVGSIGGHQKLSKTARFGSAIAPTQVDYDNNVAAGNEELRRTRSGRGEILPTSQTTPNVRTSDIPAAAEQHRRKRGLMSVFSRKKHHQHVQEGADVIGRPEAPTESAVRRDTKLERSKAELKGLRNQGQVDQYQEVDVEERLRTPATIDTNNTSEISPKSHPHPRLQKRGSIMPSFSLHGRSEKPPPRVEETMNGGGIPMPGFIRRSGTTTNFNSGSLGTRSISGGSGPNGPFAPGLNPRRASTATALSVVGTEVVPPERSETPTGKKKKFGALRRMFGRTDNGSG
ncbi:hypothetical protein N0V85_006532 [Neurospora sp. IMI 360204]|nr:hypothetical protein N0V85_006532 [Neurospora sp. IMI 360204]